MMDLGGTCTMHGKLVVIFNTYRLVLLVVFFVADMKFKLFKKGVRPKLTATDQQVIDFNKSKYHALFHWHI